MPEPEFLHDGNYQRPVPVGSRRFEYPFRHNGDRVSALFEEDYWQRVDTFHPMEFTTPHPELRDFYLVGESQPVEFMAGLVRFTRLFSRVPRQQVVPSSMFVTKPLLSGNFPLNIGGSTVIQPEEGVGTFQFYTMAAVTFDPGGPIAIGAGQGNFTLSAGPNTSVPIPIGESAANVKAALNGMGIISARNGINVTKESDTQWVAVFDGDYFPGVSAIGGSPAGYINTTNLVHAGGGATSNGIWKWTGPIAGFYDRIYIRLLTGNGSNAFTGGNFQMIFGGVPSTVVANHNATHAQMAAMVAAHPYGSGIVYFKPSGVYSSGPNDILEPPANSTIHLGFQYSLPTLTGNTDNVFPPGGVVYANAINSVAWRISVVAGTFTERVILTGVHGLSNSDTMLLRDGSNFEYVNSGNFSVVNATAVALNSAAGNAFSYAGTWTAIGRLGSTYAGGGVSVLTRIRKQTDFYLPGITPGISSADDVPLPVFQGSDSELVQAILGNSTQINYEVGELTQWRQTPILARTTITINPATI
jgi:hypothetical protein